MLDSLARSALEALAIARRAAKAHAEILELSERDQLSGISNRRSLEHFLRAEFDRWKRTDRAFSVLLIDVDSFKQINDGCGHEMGDRVIEAMGRLLRESCRAIDCPGRYGGDEFLVILPETAKDQATIVAARIAAAAAEAGRSLGLPAGLSLSIGLADSSGLDPTAAKPDPARLVAMADAAMYQVKRSGKGAIGVA